MNNVTILWKTSSYALAWIYFKLLFQVHYLKKVLSSLEQYANADADWELRFVLLLWLVILCKNPFDFSRISPVDGPSGLIERIIDVAIPYLYRTANSQVLRWFMYIKSYHSYG